MTLATGAAVPRARRPAVAWCLYDWANSAFPAVVSTFVFATYFTEHVARDVASGTAQWGVAAGVSGMLIALFSPVLGAVADAGGQRRLFLGVLTWLTVLATALLASVQPTPDHVTRAMLLVIVGTVAFELATVFYNAMLPDVTERANIGRVSGIGWGCGYFGGLMCLLLALWMVMADPPWFGMDPARAEPVRLTMVLTAAWIAVFAWPAMTFIPDRPGRDWGIAVRNGLWDLVLLIRRLPRERALFRFMIARLFYTDGLNTLFAFGAIYAAGKFGLPTEEVLIFGILLNITGGLGAIAFAFIEDRIGARRTVLIALAALIVLGGALLVVQGKTWFWICALPLGAFMGPAQAASRSLMAHMVPAGQESSYFGLFALSGRVTAFVGPMVLAALVAMTGSQTIGMGVVLVFLTIGLSILLTVDDTP